jgi:chromosome segregation ATPase
MKRLGWINLFGVVALAALCAVQWQRDRHLNLEVNRLEKERQIHQEKISEQQKAASGLSADLARFKEQFKEAHADASGTRSTLRKVEQENAQLTRERDQLKASVTNWAAAVTVRDQTIREVNDRLRDTTARLNDSVRKFNDLATNYNASIKRFSELATNYNSVVTQFNELRSKTRDGLPAK